MIFNSPQITGGEAHEDRNDPVHPVAVNVHGHDPIDVLGVVLAHQEQRNEHDTRQRKVHQVFGLGLKGSKEQKLYYSELYIRKTKILQYQKTH